MRSYIVQVSEQGITLPEVVCQQYELEPGATLSLIDLDGIFGLSLRESLVPGLAREIERLRIEADLSFEELLVSLREQRDAIYRERCASDDPAETKQD